MSSQYHSHHQTLHFETLALPIHFASSSSSSSSSCSWTLTDQKLIRIWNLSYSSSRLGDSSDNYEFTLLLPTAASPPWTMIELVQVQNMLGYGRVGNGYHYDVLYLLAVVWHGETAYRVGVAAMRERDFLGHGETAKKKICLG